MEKIFKMVYSGNECIFTIMRVSCFSHIIGNTFLLLVLSSWVKMLQNELCIVHEDVVTHDKIIPLFSPATGHVRHIFSCVTTSSWTIDVHFFWFLTRQNTLIYLQMVCTRCKGRKCRCCININNKQVIVKVWGKHE